MKIVYLCIMQKSVSILLATWVLLLSSHVPLHAHFCCDRLVDASLYNEAKTCCSNQKPTNDQPVFKKICCSNLEVVFDGYEDCAPPLITDFVTVDFVSTELDFSHQTFVVSVEKPIFSGKDPPDPSKVSLYTLFEVYLI